MVAGRTISRWGKRREYAGSKPVDPDDAEYYDVELEEILNGERRNEDMDREAEKYSIEGSGLQ